MGYYVIVSEHSDTIDMESYHGIVSAVNPEQAMIKALGEEAIKPSERVGTCCEIKAYPVMPNGDGSGPAEYTSSDLFQEEQWG